MNTTLPSGPVLAVLAILSLIHLALLVAGLVTWLRAPAERIVGNRYLWLALILMVGIAGPLVFLLAGRRPTPAVDPQAGRAQAPGGQTEVADRVSAAVDNLYPSQQP